VRRGCTCQETKASVRTCPLCLDVKSPVARPAESNATPSTSTPPLTVAGRASKIRRIEARCEGAQDGISWEHGRITAYAVEEVEKGRRLALVVHLPRRSETGSSVITKRAVARRCRQRSIRLVRKAHALRSGTSREPSSGGRRWRAVVAALVLGGCGGKGQLPLSPSSTNAPPVVVRVEVAGAGQVVLGATAAVAAEVRDPDGDVVGCRWTAQGGKVLVESENACRGVYYAPTTGQGERLDVVPTDAKGAVGGTGSLRIPADRGDGGSESKPDASTRADARAIPLPW
jgi:hypothetical protein